MPFIDVYHIDFQHLPLPENTEVLDDAERSKALRITNKDKRQRFVKSRTLLRNLLSEYLDCPAADILIHYNQYGKPSLSRSAGFHFNLSHSGALGLVAVSSTEIGVDLERIDNRISYKDVARQVFSQKEQMYLQSRMRSAEQTTFYNLWTRKEAYLKARGTGFSAELEMISVHSEDHIVEDLSDNRKQTPWYVWNFPTCEGYLASVAASIKNPVIRHIEFAGLKNRLCVMA